MFKFIFLILRTSKLSTVTIPSGCRCSTPSSPSPSVWLSPLPLTSSSVFVPFSLPMILDHSQLISSPYSVLCFTKPPSCSFIRSVALLTFPVATSTFVSLTLSWCSLWGVSHFLYVSLGTYTLHSTITRNGDIKSRTLLATVKLCLSSLYCWIYWWTVERWGSTPNPVSYFLPLYCLPSSFP